MFLRFHSHYLHLSGVGAQTVIICHNGRRTSHPVTIPHQEAPSISATGQTDSCSLAAGGRPCWCFLMSGFIFIFIFISNSRSSAGVSVMNDSDQSTTSGVDLLPSCLTGWEPTRQLLPPHTQNHKGASGTQRGSSEWCHRRTISGSTKNLSNQGPLEPSKQGSLRHHFWIQKITFQTRVL